MIHIEITDAFTTYYVGDYKIVEENYPPKESHYKDGVLHCEYGPAVKMGEFRTELLGPNGNIMYYHCASKIQYWHEGAQLFPNSLEHFIDLIKFKHFI